MVKDHFNLSRVVDGTTIRGQGYLSRGRASPDRPLRHLTFPMPGARSSQLKPKHPGTLHDPSPIVSIAASEAEAKEQISESKKPVAVTSMSQDQWERHLQTFGEKVPVWLLDQWASLPSNTADGDVEATDTEPL